MRQEIEIALESMNGELFRGTLTRQEVKFQMYKECLGFTDFSNFDGVRFGHKGCPTVIIKFIEAINVDELFPLQHFDFKRRSSVQGRMRVDVIKCKIRGIRQPGGVTEQTQNLSQADIDEGVRTVKIDGCDYRVPEESLVEFLSFYGTILSEIMEDTFDDGLVTASSGGNNRTGVYSVTIKLRRDIPQFLPIMGRRIKIHYRGVQKLCPNCFGPHPKQACHSTKKLWKEYVNEFKDSNTNIPADLFGKWFGSNTSNDPETSNHSGINNTGYKCTNLQGTLNYQGSKNAQSKEDRDQSETLGVSSAAAGPARTGTDSVILADTPGAFAPVRVPVSKESIRVSRSMDGLNKIADPDKMSELDCGPKKSDYLVPVTRAEEDEMIDRLIHGGSLLGEAEQIIASRKLAFNKACREFKKAAGKPSKWVSKSQKGKNKKKNTGSHVDPTDINYEN
jgi:hypothetical protein